MPNLILKTPKRVVVSISDKLPPVGERVIVVCKASRGCGYLDRHGYWFSDPQYRQLQDVVGWVDARSDNASTAEQTPSP
jgi:hypothetical protein